MIPLTILGILLYGFMQKVNIYDEFVEGAKEGLTTAVKILPTIIGLMMAVGIIRASGALNYITAFARPLTDLIGFPSELVPLSLMRPISSMASTGLVLDLFEKYGPDSYIGRVTSVMMGCTETVFYTMSVYYMSVNIKKTKHTLAGALISNVAGMIASIYICLWLFGK